MAQAKANGQALDRAVAELTRKYRPLAVEILKEAIRVPADHVDLPVDQGGDPKCGLSNHEKPRLESMMQKIIEIGAVDKPADVFYDAFGNLVWQVQDPNDGVPANEKTVVYFDGHTDTVQALRPRWREAIGGGIDAYDGLVNANNVDRAFLKKELGYLPPEDEWKHLVWGRGAADQLSGVVSQIVAAKVLRETRELGSLHGVVVRSYGTVAEEDNDGGSMMYVLSEELPKAGVARVPDAVILTEGTGCAQQGAAGIYRGQRGRMQIEVVVTGKSCHGSMPWEGRNPLEYGAAIIAEAADRYNKRVDFGDDKFLGHGTRTASFATLDTPSDCAVPERFTFRFDRRLTAGEDPDSALRHVESMQSVTRAREAGLGVEVRAPFYDLPSWRSYKPGNLQIYPGWVTPETHPAITCAVDAYRRSATPIVETSKGSGSLSKDPRVGRWIFSTDGVGYPVRDGEHAIPVTPAKRWVRAGAYSHAPMFGIGPGIEQNTHKIGECVDSREFDAVIATLARFPSLYHASRS